MSTDYSKIIADRLSRKDVVRLLDLDSYCMAVDAPVPFDRTKQLKKAVEAGLIVIERNDRYGITIGGALLLARDIAAFPSLASARIRLSFGEEGTMLFDQGYIPFFISVTSLFDSGSASGIPLRIQPGTPSSSLPYTKFCRSFSITEAFFFDMARRTRSLLP